MNSPTIVTHAMTEEETDLMPRKVEQGQKIVSLVLPVEIWRGLRLKAAREDKTLQSVAAEALRKVVEQELQSA